MSQPKLAKMGLQLRRGFDFAEGKGKKEENQNRRKTNEANHYTVCKYNDNTVYLIL